MDRAAVQKILDGLDARLALGEIDLGTYNSLKVKFAAQLTEAMPASPLDAAAVELGREAVSLKCPNCMAPLPAAQPEQTNITCEYCGSTAVLQTARGQMEKLREDVRKWISGAAGVAAAGEGVDAAARQFIFRDKLWPQLKVAADRATELYHPTRYLPLFSFPLLDRLSVSPFLDAVAMTPDLTSLTERLRGVVAQVQAPELLPFAVGEREKCDLHALEVGCMEITHLSNVRHRLQGYSADGLSQARANLRALGELYTTAAKMSTSNDPSYAKFTRALADRVGGVDRAIEVLGSLLASSEGAIADKVISDLDHAAQKCEQAASEIDAAGREPKEAAPAAEGTRNDAQAIRMLTDTVRIYADCAVESGVSFGNFLGPLHEAVDKATAPGAGTDWLKGFLDTLARHIGAVGGGVQVPVVRDFGWVDAVANAGTRSSLFGGRETPHIDRKILMPFWVSEIHFSAHSGSWFWKKGQAAQGIFMMDATRHGGTCHVEPADSPLTTQCYEAVESPCSIGQFAEAVAPVVDADAAHACMKREASSSQDYRGAFIKPPTIIYVPAAVVRYASKKAERKEVYLPGASPRTTTFNQSRIKLGVRELLLAV